MARQIIRSFSGGGSQLAASQIAAFWSDGNSDWEKKRLNQKLSISAFFPAYNDAGTIASMVVTTLLVLRQLSEDYEVIVINDGSKDHTPQVLDELARVYPNEVRIVHHPKNRGYGGALRSGFKAATKEWIFYTDGDAQYDPREMTKLAALVTDQIDFVNGWKIERHDPWHRIVIGRLYQYTIKLFFGLKLKDVDCDFRLMRREVFDKVELEANSGVICVELMKKVQDNGFRMVETPVHHFHRAYGKSQFFNFPRLFQVARDLGKLWRRLVWHKEHLNQSSVNREPLSVNGSSDY
jgi:glycosyltransferase involved in cell wall biosynthesis